MAKAEKEVKSLFVEFEKAGASIGSLGVFHFMGGRFGVDSYDVIYQDKTGMERRGQWEVCPNEKVAEYARQVGIL